jgi:two-component system, OmpR family, sensor kinase
VARRLGTSTLDAEAGWRVPWLRSLRARLALAIAVILVAALGTAFLATYRGTGAQVQAQIDQDLRQEATAFEQKIPLFRPTRRRVTKAAQRYLADQITFTVTPRLYVVRVAGGGIVSSLPDLSPSGSAAINHDVAGPRRESPEAASPT